MFLSVCVDSSNFQEQVPASKLFWALVRVQEYSMSPVSASLSVEIRNARVVRSRSIAAMTRSDNIAQSRKFLIAAHFFSSPLYSHEWMLWLCGIQKQILILYSINHSISQRLGRHAFAKIRPWSTLLSPPLLPRQSCSEPRTL